MLMNIFSRMLVVEVRPETASVDRSWHPAASTDKPSGGDAQRSHANDERAGLAEAI